MFLTYLCPPVIVYIGFSIIQIIIDIYNGIFNQAFLKFIIMIIFALIINILCDLGYNVIAWFLVFIPIIMMTIISTLLLKVFGLNPDEDNLQKNIEYSNDNENNENNGLNNGLNKDLNLSGVNLLNQQKYMYLLNEFNTIERVDRDEVRNKLYQKINKNYNIPDLNEISPNLSYKENPVTYFIADLFINVFGERMFINNIKNHKLFRTIFCNYLQKSLSEEKLSQYKNELIEISPQLFISCNFDLCNNEVDLNYNDKLSKSLGYRSNFSDYDEKTYQISDNNNDQQNKYDQQNKDYQGGISYSEMYDDIFKMDGYFAYLDNNYNTVTEKMRQQDPDYYNGDYEKIANILKNDSEYTKEDIIKIISEKKIEDDWKNLNEAERTAWNDSLNEEDNND